MVSRRDFVGGVTAMTLATLHRLEPTAAKQESAPKEVADSPMSTAGSSIPSQGGISTEHFEAARKRAASVVAKMTLREKASQFGVQVPAIPRLGLPAFQYYANEALHGLMHLGPVTAFPQPLALGSSWNCLLIYRVFEAVSDEIWAWHKKSGEGLAMFSPPTVNMGSRDPRWGRIAENYSEDPYQVGQMAIQTIRGMQGDDPRYLKTIACAKHYIGNATEDDRHVMSASMDARNFWEYYTRGFEASVKDGGVFTVMSSYNALNGVPTSANKFLLKDVLRDRWGFRGYVVTDCDAIADICRGHHFVPDYVEASAIAVNAGCDINCGKTLQMNLERAVSEMLVSESALNESLIRSITGRVLLGELDPPEQNPYSRIEESCLSSKAHQELAREAARQSIILFKNENGTLPLDKTKLKKIAVIGPMAYACHLGNYSGSPWFRVSPLQGIRNALGIKSPASYEKLASEFARMGAGPQGIAWPQWFNKPQQGWCSEGGECLENVGQGSWVSYEKVSFTGATEFQARVASNSHQGSIEVRLDSLDGTIVATMSVPNSGGLDKWINVSAPLKPVEGPHEVYLRFVTEPNSTMSLQSFHLSPKGQVPVSPSEPTEVNYAMGCSVNGDAEASEIADAVRIAKEADVVLLFVGADQQIDTEGHDRRHIHLPGAQHELAKAVFEVNQQTILVISSNCPVAVNWEDEHLPAVVGGVLLGEQQGNALADVLFGEYNPGGKTSVTWYRRVEDLPDFHDYNIREGRTYMYFRGDPLYPFGYGLSYTKFEYKNLRLSSSTLSPGKAVAIAFDLANRGDREGDEVVQVYVHVHGGTVIRPIQQLVAFDRIHLKPSETRTVTFNLPHDHQALCYWSEDKDAFVIDPGMVDVMVGSSSSDIRLKSSIRLMSVG